MLVYEDGSQAGTLGGGCVEAEVKRRALGLLAENRSEVCTFQLDSDYGWDDGLICGGRMKVLIAPVGGDAAQRDYFLKFTQVVAVGQGITEAVVFDAANGLTSPAAYLFDAGQRLLASLRESEAP